MEEEEVNCSVVGGRSLTAAAQTYFDFFLVGALYRMAPSPPSWRFASFALEAEATPESKSLFDSVMSFALGGSGSGGAVTPRMKGRYYVVTREDVGAVMRDEGLKSMGAAFCEIVKRDEERGIEEKNRRGGGVTSSINFSDDKGDKGDKGDEGKEELQEDPDEEPDDPEAMERLAKQAAAEEARARQQEEFDEAIASLDLQESAPDRIYLLTDFPSTTAEFDDLMSQDPSGGLIDGIVTLCGTAEPTVPASRARDKVTDPDPPRPVTAFDVHGDTDPALPRPATNPNPGDVEKIAKEKERKKYYYPTSGLSVDVQKSLPSKPLPYQDLVFAPISSPNPPTFLADFNRLLGDLAVDRAMFKSWVSSMVPVPTLDLTTTKAAMSAAASAPYAPDPTVPWSTPPSPRSTPLQRSQLKRYAEVMSEIPEPVVGPSVVLFAVVTAVSESHQSVPSDTFHSLKSHHVGPLGPGPVPVSYGDGSSLKIASGELELSVLPDAGALDSRMLVAIERSAFEGMEFPRTYGRGSLPVKATKSNETRGIERTELLTFTSLSPADIDRVTQLTYFEKMLNGAYEDIVGANNLKPWVLTNRTLFEDFAPHSLSQVLAAAMMPEPAVFRRYHAATDTLLLALHNPTARGRVGQRLWKPEGQIRHRPPFNEWRISPRLNATPRTQSAQSSGIEVPAAAVRRLTTHTMHLFPADHAAVVIRTMCPELADAVDDGTTIPRDAIGGQGNSFLSIYHDGHVFGLRHAKDDGVMVGEPDEGAPTRPEGRHGKSETDAESEKRIRAEYRKTGLFASHYVCDFEGGVRVHACEGSVAKQKPDGYHTITLRHTFPSGLIVSNCSDGSVRMDTVTSAKVSVFGEKAKEELCRVVQSRGTVIRHLRNGCTHILYSDGSSAFKAPDDVSFTTTAISDGRQYKKSADPYTGEKVHEAVATLDRTVELDPETKAVVTTVIFPDKTRTRRVDYDDGATLVVHSEGTVVRSAKKIPDEDGNLFVPYILVEAKGFAAVEFDVEVDLQARNYAHGKQVAISKGGDRIRSRTAFPDGSYALTTFDTRITSPLCGRVIAVRPDRTEIVASDDGVVVHRVRKLWNGFDSYENEQNRKKPPTAPEGKKKKMMTIKDDPDAQPDPDLISECYVFELVQGRMSTRDPESNLFEAWLGAVPKSGFVNVELAGVLAPPDTNEGMKKVPAVVNEPIEPRMFVVARDGSGTEILRSKDIQDWERRVLNEKERMRDVTKSEAGGAIERFGDPQDLKSQEREFEVKFKHVSGEGMHEFGSLFCKVFGIIWAKSFVMKEWHKTVLPDCCKFTKSLDGRSSDGSDCVFGFEESESGNVLDRCPEVVVTRRWTLYEGLDDEGKMELLDAIEACEQWRMARQNTIERFSVDDDRPIEMIKAEESMAKVLKRAYKAAKANRKRERETMLKKQKSMLAKQQASEGGAGAPASGASHPGMGHLHRVESAVLEEEEDEWDSDDDDEEGDNFVEEDNAEYKEAQEVFSLIFKDDDDDDEDESDATDHVDEVLDLEGVRAALVQLLGYGVSRKVVLNKMGGNPGKKVAFSEFYRILNSIKSDKEKEAWGDQQGDDSESRVEEEKKAENTADYDETDKNAVEVMTSYGAYFNTADGKSLRERTVAEGTYFMKKKGDIRLLSEEPIPAPAVNIRPKTSPVVEIAFGLDGTVAEQGSIDSEVMGIFDIQENEPRSGTAPAALGNIASGSMKSRSSSPDASMSLAELREVAAAGTGRNAVRARSLLDKEEGKRLRAGERPAIIDIYGDKRDKPVKAIDRAKGSTNWETQRVENDAVKGRNTPDVSIRSLSPSPTAFMPAVGTGIEVIPALVNFGVVTVGEKWAAKLDLANTGTEKVRYTIHWDGNGLEASGTYTIGVGDPPRGLVAAGIHVPVVVELDCQEAGEVRSSLQIKSQYDTVDIEFRGTVVSASEKERVGKDKKSRQVYQIST